MTPDSAIALGREALWLTCLIAAPMLIVSLVVGLVVGVLQAATQLQEPAVAFLLKLAAVAMVMAVVGPSLLNMLTDFTRRLIASIPALIA